MSPAQRKALQQALAILERAGLRPEVTRMYGARKVAAILIEMELTDKELEERDAALGCQD